AVAFARLLGLPAAPVRARQHVAFDELLIPGEHLVAGAAVATVEARLVHAVERDADLPALQHVADLAALRGLLHRPLHQRLGPAQEPLTGLDALAARGQAPIDDVHDRFRIRLSRLALLARTLRPCRGPAVRCCRAPPRPGRTRSASARSRRPFGTLRK